MNTNQIEINLPCLPLTEFWQEGIKGINMSSFIRDIAGFFSLDENFKEYKNLLVNIKVFTDTNLIELHKPWKDPDHLVFESITIQENNVVDIFFGS